MSLSCQFTKFNIKSFYTNVVSGSGIYKSETQLIAEIISVLGAAGADMGNCPAVIDRCSSHWTDVTHLDYSPEIWSISSNRTKQSAWYFSALRSQDSTHSVQKSNFLNWHITSSYWICSWKAGYIDPN